MRIRQRLAEAIYEHRLPPGTKLRELDLCRIFGVSRNVVRNVFTALAAEQLVDLFPNRGAFVARPSVEETRDVYELRRILEAGVIRCLARNHRTGWNDGWTRAVRAQIAEEREASGSGDTPRYIRLSGKFHLDLAGATRNAALERHLQRVIAQTSLMMALYDVPGTNACSFHEHIEILEAIEAADFAKAEQLLEEHLRSCERHLRLDLETRAVDLAQALGAASDGDTSTGNPSSSSAARLERDALNRPIKRSQPKRGGKRQ